MDKLKKEDLYSLEQYAEVRPEFRAKVLAHKQPRKVTIGKHLTLYFEDRLTMQYQIQEMLRIERIFEAEGIEEELGAYNPLIPDGNNLKATMMIEYDDVEERRQALTQLVGIEDKTWIRVNGHDKVYAIADEDLERTDAGKTSAVHFVRFQLTPEMMDELKNGGSMGAGCDLGNYPFEVEPLPPGTLAALVQDLN